MHDLMINQIASMLNMTRANILYFRNVSSKTKTLIHHTAKCGICSVKHHPREVLPL